MSFDRRQFLLSSGALFARLGPLGLIFGNSIVRADALNPLDKDHFFILMRTQGGLDVTLGLDPQVYGPGLDQNDIFIEYLVNQIFDDGKIKLAPAGAPLQPHAGDLAVINGIFMSSADLGHQVGNEYISSGMTRTNPPTLPFSLGLALGTGPLGIITSGGSTGQSNGLLVSNAQYVLSGQVYSDSYSAFDLPGVASSQTSQSEFARSQRAAVETVAVAPKLKKLIEEMRAKESTLTEAHAIAAAMAAGGAKQAEINLTFNQDLDSHSDHETKHLRAQQQVWAQVADLFKIFKAVPYNQGALFDHTTFMVISEFSRTPALNGSRGKDHNNYTNSVLLAGKGINNGVFGASRVISRKRTPDGMPLHMAAPFDFRAGAVAVSKDQADFIRPENVAASVASIYGQADNISIKNARVIPGLIKS